MLECAIAALKPVLAADGIVIESTCVPARSPRPRPSQAPRTASRGSRQPASCLREPTVP